MKEKRIVGLLVGLMMLPFLDLAAQGCPSKVELTTASEPILIGHHLSYFVDENGELGFDDVQKKEFVGKSDDGIISFGITRAAIWIKVCVQNGTPVEDLFFLVQQPAIDTLVLFTEGPSGKVKADSLGKYKAFNERFILAPDYIFPVTIAQGTHKVFYLKVSSTDQLQLPLYIGSKESILQKAASKNLRFGLYAGAVLIMMLYNFFISVSTRDSSYAFYILYIFSVGLTQALFQGYAYMYLWPESTFMARYNSIIVPFFSGLLTIAFIKTFLHTRFYTPKLDVGINFIVVLYVIGLLIGLYDKFYGVQFLQIAASVGTLYVLFVVNQIRKQGYRPALFFLIAFSLFFLSVILFVLRNFNIIGYNAFTSHILEIGSILEISLLSFALADRINFYRKEKEASQAEALKISEENARIISEQNILLETEVAKRTVDLKKTNEDLSEAMRNLTDAQAHLVESEKLASLGMLTAGIAHEINNPINFVTSNVQPLRRDVEQLISVIEQFEEIGLSNTDDQKKKEQYTALKETLEFDYLKTEIQLLLNGIEEGAIRTAEIVKSLRVFSRVDEDDLKPADLNLGIESTLVILNSMIRERAEVEKHYGVLPPIECFPGKLNQVFLNLITNAVHAIETKFGQQPGGKLTIRTYADDRYVYAAISDNGTGIAENIKNKIFDPFFTTKDVGEGTGLGLAIVLHIINKHKGEISCHSEINKGSEFIIKIPIARSGNAPVDSGTVQP